MVSLSPEKNMILWPLILKLEMISLQWQSNGIGPEPYQMHQINAGNQSIRIESGFTSLWTPSNAIPRNGRVHLSAFAVFPPICRRYCCPCCWFTAVPVVVAVVVDDDDVVAVEEILSSFFITICIYRSQCPDRPQLLIVNGDPISMAGIWGAGFRNRTPSVPAGRLHNPDRSRPSLTMRMGLCNQLTPPPVPGSATFSIAFWFPVAEPYSTGSQWAWGSATKSGANKPSSSTEPKCLQSTQSQLNRNRFDEITVNFPGLRNPISAE